MWVGLVVVLGGFNIHQLIASLFEKLNAFFMIMVMGRNGIMWVQMNEAIYHICVHSIGLYSICQACVATKMEGHKMLQFQPLDLPTSGSALTLETIGR
jgi:hypothetical protein